jgi:hypothetical protein
MHPDGGQWTRSCAQGEAVPTLEAEEADQGKAFGELVRERRRQRGVPLPIADKVLPFVPRTSPNAHSLMRDDASADEGMGNGAPTDALRRRRARAEGRVAEAFAALTTGEQRRATRQVRDRLKAACFVEEATARALMAQVPALEGDASRASR